MSASRLQHALETMDAGSRRWFEDALARRGEYENDGLERALGIAGQHAAREYRDTIIEVARLLDPGGELRPWPLAEKVAAAIEWFGSRGPQTPTSELDRALWRAGILARSTGVRPIGTQRKIYVLLTEWG